MPDNNENQDPTTSPQVIERELFDAATYDLKRFADKLKGMHRIQPEDIKAKDHVRYCCNGYESGRKTVYAVCVRSNIEENKIICRGYKALPGSPNWCVDLSKHKYKNYTFWQRAPKVV